MNVDRILLLNLWISLILTGILMDSKPNSSSNKLPLFLILAGWWSAGSKYLTKHHVKHSLLSKFSILIKHFFGNSNSSGAYITAAR